MRIVIEIPEENYERLKYMEEMGAINNPYLETIANGTPLPEGAEILTAEAYSDLCLRASRSIEWHPYPEEKPSGEEFSMKCYLVTLVGWRETPMIDIGWHDEFGWHKNHIEANRIDGVTAWAELPAPYRRENEDGTG